MSEPAPPVPWQGSIIPAVRRRPLIYALAAAAASLSIATFAHAAADPAEVVAAEKAFAADGVAMGIKGSFVKWAAPDGLVLAPDPVNAIEFYGKRPDNPNGARLEWWPLWAGVASSGDLGFTTGPYNVNGDRAGWYFTVWARQPDGGFKWIFDGGTKADASGAPDGRARAEYLDPTSAGSASAEAAMAEVTEREADLAKRAATDVRVAHLRHLAEDAHLMASNGPPATRRAMYDNELQAWPDAMQLTPLGGRASQTGDLVFTYGDAKWGDGRGHYAHVWQKRPQGWKLVFAELIPVAAD